MSQENDYRHALYMSWQEQIPELGHMTLEELYQAFAERFRRENMVHIPDSARGKIVEEGE